MDAYIIHTDDGRTALLIVVRLRIVFSFKGWWIDALNRCLDAEGVSAWDLMFEYMFTRWILVQKVHLLGEKT